MLAAILFGTTCNLCYGLFGRLSNGSRRAPLQFGVVYMLINSAVYMAVMLYNHTAGIEAQTLALGIAAGVCQIMSVHLYIMAMQCGYIALTALISSCGILVPVVCGALFLSEKITLLDMTGLAVMLSSIFVIQYRNDKVPGKMSMRWLLFAVGAMLTNGVVLFIMKLHQHLLPGQQINEYLFVLFTAGGAAGSIFLLFMGRRGENEKRIGIIKMLLLAAVLGLSLSFNNRSVMSLSLIVPSVMLFPVMSGGMMISTAAASAAFFKERLGKRYILGIILGIAGIVLLS